ncbi:MAG: SMC-Scp complex subunit ScpB [Chromatocurvus sp.]
MTQSSLVQIVEGALLAAGRPLTLAQLGELFEEHEKPTTDELREALDTVAGNCEGRGFELKQVASGYRFQVRESLSQWIGRLWHERPQKYSRALLETLALIAYRQPITRGEIEEIRGVAVSSNIIRTLQEREWVRVVGHRDVPGRPAMYATTRGFLDYFNLRHLDQLPALAEIRDLETLNAELGFGPLPDTAAPEAADTDHSGAPEAEQAGAIAAEESAAAKDEESAQDDDVPATDNAPVDDDGNTTLDADKQSRQVPDHG